MTEPIHTLLLTGGILRPNGFELGEGKYYGSARLLGLDLGSGDIETLIAVDEGSPNFPPEHPNLEFTIGDAEPGTLWLSMDTEVRRYGYPSLERLATYSHPCFQNIHSVAVRGDRLFVTSTGLDRVVVLDKHSGAILEQTDADGGDLWKEFSPDVDYRKVHSTRPHASHPNYVFWLDGQPWVTRCTQEDAAALGDPRRRIDLSGPKRPISVHDGIVHDHAVYFTLVDGTIVVADAHDMEAPPRRVELTALEGFGGLRGWCRGLCIADGLLYVGFSRLRRTRNQSKLDWVRRALHREAPIEECSVLAIDFEAMRIVRDYRIPVGRLDALYSILVPPVVP